MPLRDHFRSPVNDTHSWDEVHGQWPGEIVRDLSKLLPDGFRAAPRVHLGSAFEVDIGSYELDTHSPSDDSRGGVAAQPVLEPTFTIDADLSDQDEYEVRIYDTERGRQLVAAIEIVSPANKDRPRTRDLLVGKITTLLQQGVCVSIVDLVTVRRANVYADLLALAERIDPQLAPTPPHLYAVTLRTRRSDRDRPPDRRLVLPHDRWRAAADAADLPGLRASDRAPVGVKLPGDVPGAGDRVGGPRSARKSSFRSRTAVHNSVQLSRFMFRFAS